MRSRIRFDLKTVDTCGVSNTCTLLYFNYEMAVPPWTNFLKFYKLYVSGMITGCWGDGGPPGTRSAGQIGLAGNLSQASWFSRNLQINSHGISLMGNFPFPYELGWKFFSNPINNRDITKLSALFTNLQKRTVYGISITIDCVFFLGIYK